MPADFNYYINRQGARGRQGIKGEPGFSPVVTVNTNTAEAYILNSSELYCWSWELRNV